MKKKEKGIISKQIYFCNISHFYLFILGSTLDTFPLSIGKETITLKLNKMITVCISYLFMIGNPVQETGKAVREVRDHNPAKSDFFIFLGEKKFN